MWFPQPAEHGGMATDICKRFGRKVRSLRLARGWRQIDLAEHADLSPTHISGLETGKREPGLRAIERLARALDVHPADLLR